MYVDLPTICVSGAGPLTAIVYQQLIEGRIDGPCLTDFLRVVDSNMAQ